MKNYLKRLTSGLLALAIVLLCLPLSVPTATAAGANVTTVADPGTSAAWEEILGTQEDGSRYAGRVWVDKSVYADGDVATLNGKNNADSSFVVDVDEANGEYFQVIFSALGSSMSTNTQVYANQPLDVVIVLDTSTSMTTSSGGKSRLQHMIEAANKLLEELLDLGDVRIAIVSFNRDSETIIDLKKYENGIVLSTNSYTNTNGGGIIYARDKSNNLLGNDSGYTSGTNLQDGIDRGMDILANAQNTAGRAPVAIVLADGRANRAVNEGWYDPTSANSQSSGDAGIMLSTLLNAAYGKTRIEKNYGRDMTVYGIGVDLSSSSNDYIFLNPGAAGANGFNDANTDGDVEDAWDAFNTWKEGSTATLTTGRGFSQITWVFDHNWPAAAGITTAAIAANINYVDNYQDVSSANLGSAFDNILQELSTGAFNPISTTKSGATGVEDTPLIYVDNIGQHMEIKNIQALHVFGQVYNITENNGTYSIAPGTGTNATTKEAWNTTEDVQINVLENADGTQQLRVYINQEILPILLEEITETTENNVTTRTLEETLYPPLRLYYTVGIDEDVLLPDGTVNTAMLADYPYVNADGTVDFYSNAFGKMNTTNADGDAYVDQGDAHVGFIPSHNNRYYYHQSQQEIFIDAKTKTGGNIQWDDDMYGVIWDEDLYKLTAMTYADFATISDSDRVYTYVTFTRPTGNGDQAEEVTYLVYATWADMKSAATYYDKVNDTFLNGGTAIDPEQTNTVVSTYKEGKTIANSDLIAVLGAQSCRVSRLHHMFETKLENKTGTAEQSYAPEYSNSADNAGDIHEHSEVIVWLGNNGKLSLPAATGIQVTKNLEAVADGSAADEVFDIQVLLDMDFADANLTVLDSAGAALPGNRYRIENSGGKVLVTAALGNGESAVIMGVPGGTTYTVTEAAHSKYIYNYTGATQAVAGTIVAGVVTNTPILPGALYITKEVVHAHSSDVFPTDYEFDFEVTIIDAQGDPVANKEFDLINNYDPNLTKLSTDQNGVMTGKLRHGETVYIQGIPAGATVTVEEVNIPAAYNQVAPVYRSRNHSGADADNDGVVTIDPQQNATVVVTNTYTPDEVDVEIHFSGTKVFDATHMAADAQFTFKLQQYKEGRWQDVEGKSVTVAMGENAEKAFAFGNLDLTYDAPGVHSYQIIEEKGSDVNITYDRSVYTFSVDVSLDEHGDLRAAVVGHNEKAGSFAVSYDSANGYYQVDTVFTNFYHKTATSIMVEKAVDDRANAGKTAAGFVIESYNATVNDGVWTIGDKIRDTVTDAQGEALLARNYDNTDFVNNDTDHDNVVTYHFIIKEKNTAITGWGYDSTEYRVTVVLTKAADETISADFDVIKVAADGQQTDLQVDGDKATITFANTYDPADAQVNPDTLVQKNLEGRDLAAGEFRFAIFKNGEASATDTQKALMMGTNDSLGKVSFAHTAYGVNSGLVDGENDTLQFAKVGKYELDVVELKGDLEDKGVTYDTIIYDLVVEVTDENGSLNATYYFEDSVDTTVVFNNRYQAQPTQVVISGQKAMTVVNGHKTIHAGDYTFGLYDADNNLIAQATNKADRTFAFEAIPYTMDDVGNTYTYTVKEIAPDGTVDGSYSAGGVTWSEQTFTVTVAISDNGDGTLNANVTGNGSQNIAFQNMYNSNPVSVTLNGRKSLDNRTLTAGEFTFGLYKTDAAFETLTPVAEDITHDASGNFTVGLGTLYEGKHYFLVKEMIPDQHEKGIHYSAAEYHITVTVTDNGTGQMSYTTHVVNPGVPDENASVLTFTNVYIPEPGELPLSGTKTYTGGKALEDDVFSVGLYNSEAELLQTAFVKADGSFTFQNLRYYAGDVGKTYTYTIKEILPAGATGNTYGNDIYDNAIYTLTVEIADEEKDGELEIAKTLYKNGAAASAITFENVFVPDAVQHPIVAKKTYNKDLIGNDFQFTLLSTDGKTSVNQTKNNAANGDIVFDPIDFAAAGEYKFKLTEKKDGILSFIRPSQAEYEITVTVVNENGILRVSQVNAVNTKNTGETALEFVNTYVIDGEDQITLSGIKSITGGRTQVKNEEFTFGLYDADDNLIESVKNDATGKFTFTTLTYDETDIPVGGQKQITYTVKEIAGSDIRVTYDQTVYTVVVTVADSGQGGVTATYTVNGTQNGVITFTNVYTPKPTDITVDLNVVKTVVNKGTDKIGPEGFTFLLDAQAEGVADRKGTSDGNGKAKFTLTFTEDDIGNTYTYQLTEVNTGVENVSYSKASYTVTVAIALDANNKLVATLTQNGEAATSIIAAFENIYNYTPEVKPDNPHTGDTMNVYAVMAAMCVSGGGLVGTAIFGRKKKEEE